MSRPFQPPPLPKRSTLPTETPLARSPHRRTITTAPRLDRGRPGPVHFVAPPDRRTHRQDPTPLTREPRRRPVPKITTHPRLSPPVPPASPALRRSVSRRVPEDPRPPMIHRVRQPNTSVKSVIRVKYPESVHPASWKQSLKSQDSYAHSLVTWVERDVQNSRYLLVECALGDETCLINLLQRLKFITSKRPPQIETRKNREPRLPNLEDNVRSTHRRSSTIREPRTPQLLL